MLGISGTQPYATNPSSTETTGNSENWLKASLPVCTLFQVVLYTPEIQSSIVSHCFKIFLGSDALTSQERTDDGFLTAKLKFDQKNDDLIINKIIEAAVVIQLSKNMDNLPKTVIQQLEGLLTEAFGLWGLDPLASKEWSKTISQSARQAIGQYEAATRKDPEAGLSPREGAQQKEVFSTPEEENDDKFGGRTTIEVRPLNRSGAIVDRKGSPMKGFTVSPSTEQSENPNTKKEVLSLSMPVRGGVPPVSRRPISVRQENNNGTIYAAAMMSLGLAVYGALKRLYHDLVINYYEQQRVIIYSLVSPEFYDRVCNACNQTLLLLMNNRKLEWRDFLKFVLSHTVDDSDYIDDVELQPNKYDKLEEGHHQQSQNDNEQKKDSISPNHTNSGSSEEHTVGSSDLRTSEAVSDDCSGGPSTNLQSNSLEAISSAVVPPHSNKIGPRTSPPIHNDALLSSSAGRVKMLAQMFVSCPPTPPSGKFRGLQQTPILFSNPLAATIATPTIVTQSPLSTAGEHKSEGTDAEEGSKGERPSPPTQISSSSSEKLAAQGLPLLSRTENLRTKRMTDVFLHFWEKNEQHFVYTKYIATSIGKTEKMEEVTFTEPPHVNSPLLYRKLRGERRFTPEFTPLPLKLRLLRPPLPNTEQSPQTASSPDNPPRSPLGHTRRKSAGAADEKPVMSHHPSDLLRQSSKQLFAKVWRSSQGPRTPKEEEPGNNPGNPSPRNNMKVNSPRKKNVDQLTSAPSESPRGEDHPDTKIMHLAKKIRAQRHRKPWAIFYQQLLTEKRHCVSVSKFITHDTTTPSTPRIEAEKKDESTVAILLLNRSKLKKLKSTMRKHGILPEARGVLWQSLVYRQLVDLQLAPHHVPTIDTLEGQAPLSNASGCTIVSIYQAILEKYKGAESIHTTQIEKDLYRTFPQNEKYRSEDGITALKRVLVAYSWSNPDVGYCQSMNFLAGLLLLFMSEEECFWIFHVISDILIPDYYTMHGVIVDSNIFMRLLAEKMPKLVDHCNKHDACLLPIIQHWLLCLWITVLPFEAALRIIDGFFYEGSRMLFRVGLALFKLNKKKILAMTDGTDIMQYVQSMPENIDTTTFWEVVYAKNPCSKARLAEMRHQEHEKLAAQQGIDKRKAKRTWTPVREEDKSAAEKTCEREESIPSPQTGEEELFGVPEEPEEEDDDEDLNVPDDPLAVRKRAIAHSFAQLDPQFSVRFTSIYWGVMEELRPSPPATVLHVSED